ncbi:MAG: stage V sporulation protein AA [Lachnospiraceae bacterium]|nr:stage V sporulation protein AA [Lachnospiraceae bacterium]MCI6533509.1 stage V sporulation protein AA [Lachnospiraceae bacterium]MDY2614377.1 stage V sporulation protein AA [Lachnospiraceae bacterium]MDY4205973.1 stage V sporulation protein AA [Lachnospiraceae bacterium]
MAGSNETVYIKADRDVEVSNPDVTLGDVLTMECSNPHIVPKLNTIKLLKFHHTDNKNQNRVAVSVLKVIECIHKEYPNINVENMGETDFIVTYEAQKDSGGIWHYAKITAVVIISFIGASFSIMAFNNDVDTTKMFAQIYQLLTGKTSDGFTILELTYCIGLIIGILTFFNHFGKKKFTVDPTPMEVEMRLYENDIQTTLIENYSRKEKELDVGSTDHTGRHRS